MKSRLGVAVLAIFMLCLASSAAAQTSGGYLGEYSANRYDPDSTSNPYGRYGSRFSQDSINNPFSQHFNRFNPDPPRLYGHDGTYIGRLGGNRFHPDSTANPYGRYGSRFSPDSVNNPYGRFGSRFSPYSATNPYATQPPRIYATDPY